MKYNIENRSGLYVNGVAYPGGLWSGGGYTIEYVDPVVNITRFPYDEIDTVIYDDSNTFIHFDELTDTSTDSNVLVATAYDGIGIADGIGELLSSERSNPIMTSATAPKGVVTTNKQLNNNYAAWKAFDGVMPGSDYNRWVSTNNSGWIQYEYETEVAIGEYDIQQDGYSQPQYSMNTWTLKASNTGSFTGEEITLDSQSGMTWVSGQTRKFTLTNRTKYKYYRIDCTSANGTYCAIGEWVMHEIEGDGTERIGLANLSAEYEFKTIAISRYDDTLTHSSNTEGIQTVSATSTYNATYPAWKAFNRTNTGQTDSWVCANNSVVTEYLTLDTGGLSAFDSVIMQGRADNTADVSYYAVEASVNNIDWVEVGSWSGPGWGAYENTKVTIADNTEYRYVRIKIEPEHRVKSTYVGFGMFTLYKKNVDTLITSSPIQDGDNLVIVKDDESIHELVASGVVQPEYGDYPFKTAGSNFTLSNGGYTVNRQVPSGWSNANGYSELITDDIETTFTFTNTTTMLGVSTVNTYQTSYFCNASTGYGVYVIHGYKYTNGGNANSGLGAYAVGDSCTMKYERATGRLSANKNGGAFVLLWTLATNLDLYLAVCMHNQDFSSTMVRKTRTMDTSAVTQGEVPSNTYTVDAQPSFGFSRYVEPDGAKNPSTIDAIPNMTSNTAPYGVVTSKNIGNVNYPAWKSANGIATGNLNRWLGSVAGGNWWGYEFVDPTIINKYILQDVDTDTTLMPRDWTFKASNTGVFGGEEVILDTNVGVTGWDNQTKVFTFVNSTAYKYYRIDITANGGHTDFYTVGEVAFVEATLAYDYIDAVTLSDNYVYELDPDGAHNQSVTDATPTMTNYTVPSGQVSSIGNYQANYAWKAFDDSTTTRWLRRPRTGWIQYKFDTVKIINKYTFDCLAGDTARMARNWTLIGSNTGAFAGEEVTLDTRVGETGWVGGVKRTYTFTNSVAYLYYRVNITLNNGDATYVGISNIELMEVTQDLNTTRNYGNLIDSLGSTTISPKVTLKSIGDKMTKMKFTTLKENT